MPEQFENGGFTLKTHQMFPSTLRRRNLKTQQLITGHFGFVFEEISVKEITWLSQHHCLRKALFSKRFPSTRKRKADVFKFPQFEERFWKALFSQRISVDGWPNRRNKAPFSNFCDGLASHPGRVEILLVGSCHRNQDKLRPDGPLGSYADFTYLQYQEQCSTLTKCCSCHWHKRPIHLGTKQIQTLSAN